MGVHGVDVEKEGAAGLTPVTIDVVYDGPDIAALAYAGSAVGAV